MWREPWYMNAMIFVLIGYMLIVGLTGCWQNPKHWDKMPWFEEDVKIVITDESENMAVYLGREKQWYLVNKHYGSVKMKISEREAIDPFLSKHAKEVQRKGGDGI